MLQISQDRDETLVLESTLSGKTYIRIFKRDSDVSLDESRLSRTPRLRVLLRAAGTGGASRGDQ